MIHVLIVDDHAFVRSGISTMLSQLSAEIEISEAQRCEQAIDLAKNSELVGRTVDLVFLDLNLPGHQNFSALIAFRDALPSIPVVVISGQDDASTVMRALELGAKSFISKADHPENMREAFTALLRGEVWLPTSVSTDSTVSSVASSDDSFGTLTERQVQVLALLVQGLSNKLIARRLGIVEATVKIHVSAILKECAVATRTQVLLEVAKRKWRFDSIAFHSTPTGPAFEPAHAPTIRNPQAS
jgi:DNA-binding NarL/FixJ family response regulator